MPDDVSRRTFLRQASIATAVAGSVAAGGVGVLGAFTSIEGAPEAAAAGTDPKVTTSQTGSRVVAHVTDAGTGQISIFSGAREVVVTDHSLAQRLLKAAQ